MYIKIPCEIVFLCTELSPFLHLTWISDTQRSTRITQNPTRSASCSGWKSKGFQLPCLITTGERDEMVQQKAKHCYLLRSSVTVMCWKLQKKNAIESRGCSLTPQCYQIQRLLNNPWVCRRSSNPFPLGWSPGSKLFWWPCLVRNQGLTPGWSRGG